MTICKLALTFNMTVFMFSLNNLKKGKYLEGKPLGYIRGYENADRGIIYFCEFVISACG